MNTAVKIILTALFMQLAAFVSSGLGQPPDSAYMPADAWKPLGAIKETAVDKSAVYSLDAKTIRSGRKTLKAEKTSPNGVAGWEAQAASLEPGRKYQVSFWIKTEAMANERGGHPFNPLGAFLEVSFRAKSSNAPLAFTSNPVTHTHDWQEKKVSFIAPEGSEKTTIRLITASMTGTVWWDNINIVKLPVPVLNEKTIVSDLDEFGGWKKIKGADTGFFHTEKITGRWWIIDPVGNGFIVSGVDSVALLRPDNPDYMQSVLERRKTETEWKRLLSKRLKDWGFNAVSYKVPGIEGFAYGGLFGIKTLNAVRENLNVFEKMPVFPDVFDKRYNEVLSADAKENTDKADKWLLGYFLNNELPWNGDAKRNQSSLFDSFMAMNGKRPGKKALVEFLRNKYKGDTASFNGIWGTNIGGFDELLSVKEFKNIKNTDAAKEEKSQFVRLVASTYFKLNHEAIRKYDPNHMILGCRFFNASPPMEVIEEMNNYVDVISFQPYELIAPVEHMAEAYSLNPKPMMVTEFGFAAEDSGLPNAAGAGAVFKSQTERGLWYERYVGHLLSSPFMVGWIWFRYMDQNSTGDWQGENKNYGLVDKTDEPYAGFTAVVAKANKNIYTLALTPAQAK
jgi:agarase